jgi:hypothetical protein
MDQRRQGQLEQFGFARTHLDGGLAGERLWWKRTAPVWTSCATRRGNQTSGFGRATHVSRQTSLPPIGNGRLISPTTISQPAPAQGRQAPQRGNRSHKEQDDERETGVTTMS